MYRIRKTIEISAAHVLDLSYRSKCNNIHGHNWSITVEISCRELNEDGMVIDFSKLGEILADEIHNRLDHTKLNEQLDFNPTAENIAKYILEKVQIELDRLEDVRSLKCTRVEVYETPKNCAIYEIKMKKDKN